MSVLLGSCSGRGSTSGPLSRSGEAARAMVSGQPFLQGFETPAVDASTGRITLPLDHLNPFALDAKVLQTLQDWDVYSCLKSSGEATMVPFVDPRAQLRADHRYGVWIVRDVQANGYPLKAAEPAALPQAPAEVRRECEEAPHPALQALEPARRAMGRFTEVTGPPGWTDHGWMGVREEWIACLREHKVAAPPPQVPGKAPSWVPKGVTSAPKAEQVRVGLIDVACKQKLNVVLRAAQIDARLQAPVLREHEASLRKAATASEAIMDSANSYLTDVPPSDPRFVANPVTP